LISSSQRLGGKEDTIEKTRGIFLGDGTVLQPRSCSLILQVELQAKRVSFTVHTLYLHKILGTLSHSKK
jgi:hypothetical protein